MALSNILRCYSRRLPAQSPCQPMRSDSDPREVAVRDSEPCLNGSLGGGYAVIGWEMQGNENDDCC